MHQNCRTQFSILSLWCRATNTVFDNPYKKSHFTTCYVYLNFRAKTSLLESSIANLVIFGAKIQMWHFWWFSNTVIWLESALFHHLHGELLSETFSSSFHQVCPLFALGTLFLRERDDGCKNGNFLEDSKFRKTGSRKLFFAHLCEKMFTRLLIFS